MDSGTVRSATSPSGNPPLSTALQLEEVGQEYGSLLFLIFKDFLFRHLIFYRINGNVVAHDLMVVFVDVLQL